MAVEDDLIRLSQMDSIYVSISVQNMSGIFPFVSWFKGRLQQANDGNWIDRSVSQDGAIIGFQLGPVLQNWQSSETPDTGLMVQAPLMLNISMGAQQESLAIGWWTLQQQLPQELTN
jgi:hypothetical protein